MPKPAPTAVPVLDDGFLAGIRGLRSFTQGCDLRGLAGTVAGPLELIELLIERGLVTKDEGARYWATALKVSYVDPFQTAITEEAIASLPASIAGKAQVLPLYVMGGALTVAMPHPEDVSLRERIAKIVKMPVSAGFALPRDVADLLKVHYSSDQTVEESLAAAEGHEAFAAGADLSVGGAALARLAEASEMVAFLNALIHFALRQRASDIHVEPQDADARVRFRIDGVLHEVLRLPRKVSASLVTRMKILGNLNITESRKPADGRFSLALGTAQIDFRYSTIPTQYGEKGVVRILGGMGEKQRLALDQMLISRSVLEPMRRIMQSPSGIFFVTGPTGSGKTTTLYSMLAEMNQSGVNISTIEDPIELRLEGISQSQVNPAIDVSFATMLRALLRQDPDIMLVGEIRDLETAKIACEAALTGHLVLTTLHTNNAPDAVTRLLEIGVEPYLLAPAVVGILGQRLAPRLCENCKEPYRPEEHVLRRYFNDEPMPDVTFYRGRGCRVCKQSGFKGRVAFHELFILNRRIRSLIARRADHAEIIEEAQRIGYRPLRYDGLKKVLLGLTTIEEIEAQTPLEFE
jgi:type IV pilus assembly protein PilB